MAQHPYQFLLVTFVFCVSFTVSAQTVTERSAHFRVVHPRTVDARDVLSLLEHNRDELLDRVASAGIDVHLPNLELVFNATTGDFVARTGLPPWAAAATGKNKIELQPLSLLKQRRILESTLRHELAHALIDTLSTTQTPRWLSEGLAAYLAGEGKLLEPYRSEKPTAAETERLLAAPKSPAEMRTAYANAYFLVRELIRAHGESNLWKRLSSN